MAREPGNRCFGEHSWRTVACGDGFFCRIVFQICDVVMIELWNFVEHEIVFLRTYCFVKNRKEQQKCMLC